MSMEELDANFKYCEREFSTLAENSSDLISQLDRDFRFLYVSRSVQALWGIPCRDFIGKTAGELGIPLHNCPEFEESCRQVFKTAQRIDREFTFGERVYKVRIIPEIDMQGQVECLMCIDHDVTERKNIERDLRLLSARLLDIREEERKRISRDLHDSTAQNLFALDICLKHLIQTSPNADFKERLNECKTLCEQARKEIRTISYLLHPPMLDEDGLASAIKWYIEGFSRRSGITVGFQSSSAANNVQVPLDVQTDLFRVVQEGLANVHRHSSSRVAMVTLDEREDQIVLRIRDWGSGIEDWNEVTRLPMTPGVGIPGMRERLSRLGGHLEIETGKSGTTIKGIVPLNVLAQSTSETRVA